jgi:hypothetical protein
LQSKADEFKGVKFPSCLTNCALVYRLVLRETG